MNLHILGSSSSGNCYILETATEALIIEAGVRMSDVKKALRWNIGKAVACVVSHTHGDHAGYIREMAASGVLVLTGQETLENHGMVGNPFAKEITAGRGYKVANFRIRPLSVKHDVPCFAYIIEHDEMGRLLFVTDTVSFDYIVPKASHILIEANYSDDIVADNIERGSMPASLRPRLLNSHMSIEETKAVLASQDLSQTDNIVLIHLSGGNSDEARFVREVREQTGKMVHAAKPGMTIDVSLKPY